MIGGVRAGLKTIMVLSGSTTRDEAVAYGPDFIFEDIAELTQAWQAALGMTFVPVHELLAACVRQPWAVGVYDTFNLEMTQGIVDAAVAERSPLLIMMLPGFMPAGDWPGVIVTHRG